MAEVSETTLPGVGVRHDFITSTGNRIGVLSHRTGHRELLVYDERDTDACRTIVHLGSDDARTLAELLGASQVSEALAAVQHEVEGLTIDWLPVAAGSESAGHSIGEGELRSRTGASIVAIVRAGATIAAPGPEEVLQAGDVAVAVGTAEGIRRLMPLLQQR